MSELGKAWRRLWARPTITLMSVAILAVGLATTHFLFGAVNGMVLRPLPFPDAGRLVAIGWQEPGNTGLGEFSADDWLRLRPILTGFDLIATDSGGMTVNLGRGDQVTRYNGTFIDANVPVLVGTQAMLGRTFTAADDQPGAPLAVLLGERVWRNDFNADPGIVGTALRANGESATVVGVMPESFGYPRGQQVWLPRRFAAGDTFDVRVAARLAPGVGFEQARLALEAAGRQLGAELAESLEGDVLSMRPLAHSFVNEITRRMAWMMFAAGLLVLLLACANVASLQLGQVMARRRELAVRSALGAGRLRLVRELLAESLLLAAVATVIAVVLAHVGGEWVMQGMIANDNLPAYYIDFSYDWRDAVFIVTAALVTCVAAGLAPALRAASAEAQADLRDGSRGSQGGFFARFSRGLVVAEIALTVVLLVGSAMFVRGIDGMVRMDFGSDADPSEVLTGRIGIFPQPYATGAQQTRFFEDVVARLRADPQVTAATAATALPGSINGGSVDVRIEGQPAGAASYVQADVAAVDPGFAAVYGVRLRAGRFIEERDLADALPVAVVDATLARRLWPDRDPLGQRLHAGAGADAPLLTVVGVIDALRLREADDRPRPTMLRPMTQSPTRFATVAMRLRGVDAGEFAPRFAEIVRGVDANTPVYWVRTQAEAIRLGRVGPVLLTQIFTGVGVLALALAAAGLYGVLAFAVAQRTREIGIRRAIGAGRSGIAGTVIRRVLWQVALGLAIGIALAVPWSRLLANPALQMRAYDPGIFAAVVGMIAVVALLAALAPLRRALRVDPIVALRHD